MVEITPEIQAQLDEQKKQCIFCKIISKEMQSSIVYEDDLVLGILDINPAVNGHMLLLPKEHYPIMPFLPAPTFSHLFGLIPALSKSMNKSLLMTGATVFVANGGVAGQQAPHFMAHLLSREKGDGLSSFSFDQKKQLDAAKHSQVVGMLLKNLPLMMQNHFKRNPSSWHTGAGSRPAYLASLDSSVVYEDEKVLVCVPLHPQSLGHLQIHSKESEHDINLLSKESSAHLFFVASFAATAVFEGLGAQGSTIVLQSGISTDNSSGRLCVHILDRYQDDGLDLQLKPMSNKPDLDSLAKKLSDGFWYVQQGIDPSKKPEVFDVESQDVKVYNLDELDAGKDSSEKDEDQDKSSDEEPEDEIAHAIKNLKRVP